MLSRGNENFRASGKHCFSFFQVENIPWSKCVLRTSPLLLNYFIKNYSKINKLTQVIL